MLEVDLHLHAHLNEGVVRLNISVVRVVDTHNVNEHTVTTHGRQVKLWAYAHLLSTFLRC